MQAYAKVTARDIILRVGQKIAC